MSEHENNQVIEIEEDNYVIPDLLSAEFDRLHQWIVGFNAPPDLINQKYFPILFEHCPKYLERARQRADINFQNWEAILDIQEKMPVNARIWQNVDEKDELLNAEILGKGKEAWKALQTKFNDSLKPEEGARNQVGFSTNGNHKEEL